MQEALSAFSFPEAIEDLKFEGLCEKGGILTYHITDAPDVLTVTAPRFTGSYTSRGYVSQKNHAPFTVEQELSLPLQTEKATFCKDYRLYCLTAHLGTQNNGHYIYYVQNNDKTWKRYDDLAVTDLSFQQVQEEVKGTCYQLVYKAVF